MVTSSATSRPLMPLRSAASPMRRLGLSLALSAGRAVPGGCAGGRAAGIGLAEGQAGDVGGSSAVVEEAVYRVRQVAARYEAAEGVHVLGPTGDERRLVDWPAVCEANKGRG